MRDRVIINFSRILEIDFICVEKFSVSEKTFAYKEERNGC